MHVTGIIAEYNPFHRGHMCQLEMVRQRFPETCVVTVMSGSFTQRGEAAVLDKWTRAQTAVMYGCDLVLELPAVYAVRSAQDFARGGVGLLSRLGIVDAIAFGTELEPIEALSDAADAMDRADVQRMLHCGMEDGLSYGKAFCRALSSATGLAEDTLRKPNTILALEYLRALKGNPDSVDICPLPLPRIQAEHGDADMGEGVSSARSIRMELLKESTDWEAIALAVPDATLDSLQKVHSSGLPDMEFLHRALLARLLLMNGEGLREVYGINEGLEHRLIKAAGEAKSLHQLVELASSARCPKSRIQRTIFYLLSGFSKSLAEKTDSCGPMYARILALNQRGRLMLREIEKKASIPVIAKPAAFINSRTLLEGSNGLSPLQEQLAFDFRAGRLRGLAMSPTQTLIYDFIKSPVYLSADSNLKG